MFIRVGYISLFAAWSTPGITRRSTCSVAAGRSVPPIAESTTAPAETTSLRACTRLGQVVAIIHPLHPETYVRPFEAKLLAGLR